MLARVSRLRNRSSNASRALSPRPAKQSFNAANRASPLSSPAQRAQVRSFSWSGLFDDLVSILPLQARLVSLEPQFGRNRRSRRDLDLRDGEVMLEVDGVARDTERLLRLIDRFFEHPSFREPDLQR